MATQQLRAALLPATCCHRATAAPGPGCVGGGDHCRRPGCRHGRRHPSCCAEPWCGNNVPGCFPSQPSLGFCASIPAGSILAFAALCSKHTTGFHVSTILLENQEVAGRPCLSALVLNTTAASADAIAQNATRLGQVRLMHSSYRLICHPVCTILGQYTWQLQADGCTHASFVLETDGNHNIHVLCVLPECHSSSNQVHVRSRDARCCRHRYRAGGRNCVCRL
jgi:hypothetical protein